MQLTSYLRGLVMLVFASASACDKAAENASPAVGQPPAPSAPSVAPDPVAQPVRPSSAGEDMAITWEDPSSWKRQPKVNTMRKATYSVPKMAGDNEDAELAVFYFGANSGGGVEANMKRWIGQFSEISDKDVRRSERNTHGLVQHLVEIESGTFASGMPGAPSAAKKNYGLLAAIVETSSGHYFFKMTGPSQTVKAAREDFLAMLDSIKTTSK